MLEVKSFVLPLVSAGAGFAAAYIWFSTAGGHTTRPSTSSSTSSSPIPPPVTKPKQKQETRGVTGEQDEQDEYTTDSDEDISEEYAARLSKVKAPGWKDDCKLVLVVNQELGMAKGKIAAQCSHATLACYKTLHKTNPKLLAHWERTGQAKVALKAASTADLVDLQKRARQLDMCAQVISDAGRTQIAAGSKTVLGIGPAPVKMVDQITRQLKLL